MSEGSALEDAGPLRSEGVTELLRQLEGDQFTGSVQLQTEAGDADVEFLSGLIVDARMEELSGRGALFRLLGLIEGSYALTRGPIAQRPALTPSVSRLLDELSQWQRLSQQAPSLSSVPELSASGRDALERHALADEQRVLLELVDGQRSFVEIIDDSGVDAVDALTLLVGAVQGRLLTVRTMQASLYPLAGGDASAVAPIVTISSNPPASTRPVHEVGAPPVPNAFIPAHRKTLMLGTSPVPERNSPVPEVHRIISIDSPLPPPPSGRSSPAGETNGEATATQRALEAQPSPQAPEAKSRARGSNPLSSPPSVGDLRAVAVPEQQLAGQPGARYIGRYQILCRIGRGGMGSVYLCRLSSQGGFRRLFALKLLRKHLLTDSAAAQRFLDEAQLAGHIHHPNVVSVVDAGFYASQPYLVMDYVEGGSLKDMLAARRDYRPPQLILPIMLDALAGLHAAHTLVAEDGTPLQIVHCDVSPENLLVGVDGVCRLTDFGVARHGVPKNEPRHVTHGKPAYLSPEQLRDTQLDCRADVFSMGVVLYQALTGVKLFDATTLEETLENLRFKKIEPPSAVGLRPPECLDAAVLRALERDREKRYASALEMMMDLRRIALRENLLAPTSDVATWVRDSIGQDLSRRRLIVLAATQGAKAELAVEPAHHARLPAMAPVPVSSSFPPSDQHQNSRTIALDSVALATSPRVKRRRWALIFASIVAAIAVLVTLVWPRIISKMFRIRTDAISEDVSGPEHLGPNPAASGKD